MKRFLVVIVAAISATVLLTVNPRRTAAQSATQSPAFYGVGRASNGTSYVDAFTPWLSAADSGSYFHNQTATPDTAYALTGATQTAFSATTAIFTVRNNTAATKLYPDFVRIVIRAAGVAGTRFEAAVVIDNAARYVSGGTALTTYNSNVASSNASGSTQVFGGAITAAAASAPRYACRGILDTANPAVGKSYLIYFGGDSDGNANSLRCPAVVLGNGHSIVVHAWLPAQTGAPTGEVSAGWLER